MKISGNEKTCPICGKHFVVQSLQLYAYKRTKRGKPVYMCSWSCLEKYLSGGKHEIISMLGEDRDYQEPVF